MINEIDFWSRLVNGFLVKSNKNWASPNPRIILSFFAEILTISIKM